MFDKLRNRIIIITMAVTTTVLILSGVLIMLFSSTARPEPKPQKDSGYSIPNPVVYDDQELEKYIRSDREEGSVRLLVTLVCVGAVIEVAVFLIVYYASQKIVEPVKDSYNKQKMFIANASHELKTPLAIMQANLEALEADKKNKKWKDNIEHEISHANTLVLDLLQLAKMDAGNADKITPEEVDLKAEIEKHIDMFKPKFPGDISLRTTGELKTSVLPKRDLAQILDILLDNATKYGDKKISVVLSNNGIDVSNDGAIVPKDDTEKIFDRFYQTDKTSDGSGLGLAIAKSICERNNWQISCESNKNTTKFIVRF